MSKNKKNKKKDNVVVDATKASEELAAEEKKEKKVPESGVKDDKKIEDPKDLEYGIEFKSDHLQWECDCPAYARGYRGNVEVLMEVTVNKDGEITAIHDVRFPAFPSVAKDDLSDEELDYFMSGKIKPMITRFSTHKLAAEHMNSHYDAQYKIQKDFGLGWKTGYTDQFTYKPGQKKAA